MSLTPVTRRPLAAYLSYPDDPPAETQSGAPITPPIVVGIYDSSGTLVTAATNPITLALEQNPAGGTLNCGPPTCTKDPVAGLATFDTLSIATVGTGYTVRATSPGLIGGQSGFFAITPAGAGAATQLAFGQPPTTAGVGATITPAVTVQVKDATGLVVTTSTAPITVLLTANPAGGTLNCGPPTCTKNAVAGEATFDTLSIATAGTGYSLGATAPGLTSATPATFAITPGPAAPTDLTISIFTTGQFLR